jgi:hypothetical protein
MTVISYPIPPYSNLPINAQYYAPSRFVISAISLGVTTAVTTTQNNNYTIGQLVRLLIPPTFGARQLNESEGYVLSITSPNQIVLSINSSVNVDPFINSSANTKAQTLAIGDTNTGATNTTGRSNQTTFVPGSFINISPA